jgi:hypothetical protein
MTDRGVLYIAYGDKARSQAQLSLLTVRHHAPGLPVAVVSDRPLPGADRHIDHPEADRGARTQKTSMYRLSPFGETLFLDADTELKSAPTAGWKLLQYVDLVLAQDFNRNFADNKWPHLNQEEVAETNRILGTRQHMYFNSGVIFFRRNERVEAMMSAWHEEWKRYGLHDQMALLRAIHRCPVRIAPLREPWNTHIRSKAAFIYHKHHQARREGSPK